MVINESDDINKIMRRRRPAFLSLIQDRVANVDVNDYDDGLDFSNSILWDSFDEFILQPGNEKINRMDLVGYMMQEFEQDLYDVYDDRIMSDNKDNINEQFEPDRLYPKDYIIKVLTRAPKELRHFIRKLQDIPCENNKGERSVCTRIPEVVQVYLDGKY